MSPAEPAPLVVVALGGHALAPVDAPSVDVSPEALGRSMDALAPLAAGRRLVVTHGNGPQVGARAAREAWSAERGLDDLDAETEGALGYRIEEALDRRLPGRGVATLLTRVEVDADDPAFDAPDKPVGPPLRDADARRRAEARGWTVGERDGAWRRLAPSPEPRGVPNLEAIRRLADDGFVVICAGGGGIPAVRREDGLEGVGAVVDKDRASALLARELGAAALLLLTDVDAVYEDWDGARRRPIGETSPEALRARRFEAGSMGPKVEAACRFAESGGGWAGIGAVEAAGDLLAGRAGTRVRAARGG